MYMTVIKKMVGLFFPFDLYTIIIICITLPISNSTSDMYDNCSSEWSLPCGDNETIGLLRYPFWGPQRPRYCGHPAMQLDCRKSLNETTDYTVLIVDKHNDYSFRVLEIIYLEVQLRMVLQANSHEGCPIHLFSNLNHVPDFYQLFTRISVFYFCPQENMNNFPHNGTCFDTEDGLNVHYFYKPDIHKFVDCQPFEIAVPPEMSSTLENGNKTFKVGEVLRQSFQVLYTYPYFSNCSLCEGSAGICGSADNSEFVCYCKSGPSPDICHPHESVLSKQWRVIVGSAFAVMGMIIALLIVLACKRMPTRKVAIFRSSEATKYTNIEAFLTIYGSFAPKRYTYGDVRKITNQFKDKIGEGGYGTVYKGKLIHGRTVAVKLLKQSKGNVDDFINEVASISRTNHVNVVTLLGYCSEGKRRALIYEFMSNGSLEKFMYRDSSYSSLARETLLIIVIGIAKGLDYLHRGCNARILHFDIKPHNILLDGKFRPKISDFGLARLCPSQESTISMLEARGTIGYIAPEVFCRNFGGVSHKSDVYSFGMMVLDMVCGRTNTTADMQQSSEIYFPEWIYEQLDMGEEVALHEFDDIEKPLQRKMILVGLWCIQTYPSIRPSMSKVLEMLQGNVDSIEMPPKPYLTSLPRPSFVVSQTATVVSQ